MGMKKGRIPGKVDIAPKQRERLMLPILNQQDFADHTVEAKRTLVAEAFSGDLIDISAFRGEKRIYRAEICAAIDKVDISMVTRRAKTEQLLRPSAKKIAFHPAFTQGGKNAADRHRAIVHGGNFRPCGCERVQPLSANASAASLVMPAQSPLATSSFGATQDPPTQTTLGSDR